MTSPEPCEKCSRVGKKVFHYTRPCPRDEPKSGLTFRIEGLGTR